MRAPAPAEHRVIVHVTRHPMEAVLLVEHLQSRGILAQAEERASGASDDGRGQTQIEVAVWSVDEDAARATLDLMRPSMAPAASRVE
jgi:hypothetical protein